MDKPAGYPQKSCGGASVGLASETGRRLQLLSIEWPSGWPIWETPGARIRVHALGVSLFVPAPIEPTVAAVSLAALKDLAASLNPRP